MVVNDNCKSNNGYDNENKKGESAKKTNQTCL